MEKLNIIDSAIRSIKYDIQKLSDIFNEDTVHEIIDDIVHNTFVNKYCEKCGRVLNKDSIDKKCITCTLIKDNKNLNLIQNKKGRKKIISNSESE